VSDNSKIEWCDSTWNPVTGCTKVSAGCDHCYAETFAERWRGTPGHHFEQGFDVRLWPERLGVPSSWRKPKRIFVNSMSDLFHDEVPDEFIARVWQVMGAAPQHTYQILTKRHARMRSWVSRWYDGTIPEPYDVRSVNGFPGYSVTTHGEVLGKRSDTRGGLSPDTGEQGHQRVTLHREGSPRSGERELVHRLVLTAFARPPRLGEQGCHRNGDPSDNRLSNLYWGTQQDNWRDRVGHGNGRAHAKLGEADVIAIRARCTAGESAYAVARDYPVSDTQIRNIIRGDQWAQLRLQRPLPKPHRVVLDSVWLGVSAEDQHWADIRIPALLDTPAAVRFVSAEPLLGPIDLGLVEECGGCTCGVGPSGYYGMHERGCGTAPGPSWNRLHWVIAGGESGSGARPCEMSWLLSLRGQCDDGGTAFFCKQLGSYAARAMGLKSPKGSDPLEWPADLQVRQFPGATCLGQVH
jgi:protein gp37